MSCSYNIFPIEASLFYHTCGVIDSVVDIIEVEKNLFVSVYIFDVLLEQSYSIRSVIYSIVYVIEINEIFIS